MQGQAPVYKDQHKEKLDAENIFVYSILWNIEAILYTWRD